MLFDTALICRDGHILTSCLSEDSHFLEVSYCLKCRSKTISSCPHCGKKILGCEGVEVECARSVETYYDKTMFKLPSYCYHCAIPYPWTDAALKEVDAIIELADELDEVDKAILKESFPNILIEGAHTVSSSLKIAKILKPLANTTGQALKSAIASKVAAKALELLGWH